MEIPTLENGPAWANYLAQDSDGVWWYYEDEPTAITKMGSWDAETGATKLVLVENWEESLQVKEKEDTLTQEDLLGLAAFIKTLSPLIKYVAMDADKELWGYTTKPICNVDMGQWVHNQLLIGTQSEYITTMPPYVELNWTRTLFDTTLVDFVS